MSQFLKKIKRKLISKSGIPIGFTNIISNYAVRNVLRHQYEENLKLNFINRFYTNDFALDPLQRDEALFLFSLIKVLRPAVCIEFGFNNGNSAFSMLQAMDKTPILYSYDISKKPKEIAKKFFYQNYEILNS